MDTTIDPGPRLPGLRHLLGGKRLEELLMRATGEVAWEGAAALGAARALAGLLSRGRGDVPGVSARLLADVAVVDLAGLEVALAPAGPAEIRVELADELALEPIHALRAVRTAWRLHRWLRRVEAGRRAPPPERGEQVIVVWRPREAVLRTALSPAEGHLLEELLLGSTVAEAIAASATRHRLEPAGAHESVALWVTEGFFSRAAPGLSPRAPRARAASS